MMIDTFQLATVSPVSTTTIFPVDLEDDVVSPTSVPQSEKPVNVGCCACMRRRRKREIDAKSRSRDQPLKDRRNGVRARIAAYWCLVWVDTVVLFLFGILILGLHFAPINSRNPPLMPFWTQVPLIGNITGDLDFRAPSEFLYPYQKTPLSDIVCAVIVTAIPIIIIGLFQLKISSAWDFHAGQVGILKAVTTTTLIVLILKLYMGGFRPHFFDVCKPNATLLNEQVAYSVQNYTSLYFNSTICTGNKRMVKNALQSFPSGHSANSFAAAIFLALYMNAKLKTIGDHASHYWVFFMTLLPLILAAILASTMYITHQHHMSDLYAGMVIGLVIGTIAYRSHYAAIFDTRFNHIPLPPFAAKTRLSYLKKGVRGHIGDTGYHDKEEIDKLVVWSWWEAEPSEQNRVKEEFWLQNIRTMQGAGGENGIKSETTLPQNEQDVITREGVEARYNLASGGSESMAQRSASAPSRRSPCVGVDASGACEV